MQISLCLKSIGFSWLLKSLRNSRVQRLFAASTGKGRNLPRFGGL
jgi:hypothetical protein